MKITSKIFIISIALVCCSGFIFGQDSTNAKKKALGKTQQNHGHRNFVDANGDGYNDNAPDHDGDGIPNGIDPDYIKLKKRKDAESLEYVDSNGDGINDNLQLGGKHKGRGRRFNKSNQSMIPQNSSGNKGMGSDGKMHDPQHKGKGKGNG
jgi:hypothetical protein